jgi:phage terminase small subunit
VPIKGGKLTAKERAFIPAMARTNDRHYAAYRAGLSQPDAAGSQLMARDAVRAEVVRVQTDMLFKELLPLAISAHRKLLTDAAVPAGARAQAVKLAYDRTIGASEGSADQKDPSEMTLDEIIQRTEALQRERSDRARDVTPSSPESSVFD